MTPIYLSVPLCDLFGAGTCGKYLLKGFAKRRPTRWNAVGDDYELLDVETRKLAQDHWSAFTEDVSFPSLQFAGPDLGPQTNRRGSPNVGYVFFEEQKDFSKLKGFDVLIAGSEWNASVLRDAGFECSAVPQGVDTEIFRPGEREKFKDRLVIYSGGKFEHRKAQDLVIKAVKVLQERHPEILLVTSWFNAWSGTDGSEFAQCLDAIHLPLRKHRDLAFWMNQTDIGLFPNRCEGGTNLVMMDYLACGKPVIANTSTGQSDVLSEDYAMGIEGTDDELVEQMIEGVERLTATKRADMGVKASAAMKNWSWDRTVDGIERAIGFNRLDERAA